MKQRATIMLFILFLTIIGSRFKVSAAPHSPIMLDLIHRDDGLGLSPHDHLKQMLARDKIRMQSRRFTNLNNNTKAASSARMPLAAGADFGIGEYFVELQVGELPNKSKLVLDTGSDFIWLNCRCGETSFKTVTCSWNQCPDNITQVFGDFSSCDSAGHCGYKYSYASGEASGEFATATFTFNLSNGLTKQVPNILMGCTESTQGLDSIMKSLDGLLGLADSVFSLPRQTTHAFGPTQFTYCLVDHLRSINVTSKLILGPSPKGFMPESSQSTHLVQQDSIFYGVKVEGLRINGSELNITPYIWEYDETSNKGGTIFDSGTTFTALMTPAYTVATEVLKVYLWGLKPVNQTIMDTSPFEFCYNTSMGNEETQLPTFEFVFENGKNFTVPSTSYFIDYNKGVNCLNLVDYGEFGPNVIGNIMQQNYAFEYNLHYKTLRFGRSNCGS